jgi:hypothetical protein
MEPEAAVRLIEKIRTFVADDLDEEERPLFAALLAPGVARAFDTVEVEGFEMVEWQPSALPRTLVDALRDAGVRVEGLGF